MTADNHNNRKFEEALQLLNDAAREKKEDIQKLVGEKYEHLREAIDTGRERAVEVFEEVDEQVKKNPWPYMGGVALGSLLLGFILGNQNKR